MTPSRALHPEAHVAWQKMGRILLLQNECLPTLVFAVLKVTSASKARGYSN